MLEHLKRELRPLLEAVPHPTSLSSKDDTKNEVQLCLLVFLGSTRKQNALHIVVGEVHCSPQRGSRHPIPSPVAGSVSQFLLREGSLGQLGRILLLRPIRPLSRACLMILVSCGASAAARTDSCEGSLYTNWSPHSL